MHQQRMHISWWLGHRLNQQPDLLMLVFCLVFLRASLYTTVKQADTEAELHGCTAKLKAAVSE